LQSPFFALFSKENAKPFLKKKFNNLQNISLKLYFLRGRVQIYFIKKLNLSLNLQVKFWEFLEERDPEKPGISREYGNGK